MNERHDLEKITYLIPEDKIFEGGGRRAGRIIRLRRNNE